MTSSVLKFLMDKAKEEKKNFSGSISLFMKATIPGTHGRALMKLTPWHGSK
jgi:hypothetical protein